ncbi:glycosyltransferase [Nocardioides sp. HM23]|uniref:glycosyltransferase n=1 Tax=Nocardioides bizhenqiangii TaxID=3095076 RepID=UPI002ACA3CD8|nr:glycosyltransferase [Nocardioides sp. HM23]MDZ5620002.1 glycosyltransferase [Nocardioides sp. HM23]
MTSVALVGFNRPQLTRRTLEAVRASRPETLFLIADGPRDDHPADAALCAEVRQVMDGVDWPCEVHRRYSERNVGCEGTVETGLDWVFSQVSEAIVLEDDCVPDPTFFEYATQLLDRYRDDTRVWQIAGNSLLVPSRLFDSDSYRFAAWASVWGWATWADRWHRHRALFPRSHAGPDGLAPVRTAPVVPREDLLVTRGGRRHFAEAATSGDVVRHGWDKQWWLSMLHEGGLAATPAVNMVENIGFGAGATHGVYEHRLEPPAPMAMPLRHPQRVALDVEVERELELLLSRVGGGMAQRARGIVTNPQLRRIGRSALHSRAAATASRVISRLTDRRTGAARGR